MNAYTLLIVLSGLVIFSYLFDLSAKHTRIPAVIMLMALGMAIRFAIDSTGVPRPGIVDILPALGNVGLIMIVFEGGLDLVYDRSKNVLIRKAFLSALGLLLITTGSIALLLHGLTGLSWLICLANAIPLSVISSAVAIPSVTHLDRNSREFVVYESSLSDILGIVAFNFVVSNESFGAAAFGHLTLEIVAVVLISAVFCMVLLWLMGRITHSVKFFLIMAILVLVYAVGKQFHLSTLVVVLAFGLFLANAPLIPFAWFKERFLYPHFDKDLGQMHQLSRESAFLLRTFFFVLFGYTILPGELKDTHMLLLASVMLALTLLLRALFLKFALRMDIRTLVYITPRGLISILLFLSLPERFRIPLVSTGLLFAIVIGTCTVMALGLIGAKRSIDLPVADGGE
ncbi:MAG: cation:proton antiporter [Flavobacteriales bacterium]|nr:cation:proton antiporter [Flavobacteriales bacterium]